MVEGLTECLIQSLMDRLSLVNKDQRAVIKKKLRRSHGAYQPAPDATGFLPLALLCGCGVFTPHAIPLTWY